MEITFTGNDGAIIGTYMVNILDPDETEVREMLSRGLEVMDVVLCESCGEWYEVGMACGTSECEL